MTIVYNMTMFRSFIGCWSFLYERWESGAFFTQTKPPAGEPDILFLQKWKLTQKLETILFFQFKELLVYFILIQ